MCLWAMKHETNRNRPRNRCGLPFEASTSRLRVAIPRFQIPGADCWRLLLAIAQCHEGVEGTMAPWASAHNQGSFEGRGVSREGGGVGPDPPPPSVPVFLGALKAPNNIVGLTRLAAKAPEKNFAAGGWWWVQAFA